MKRAPRKKKTTNFSSLSATRCLTPNQKTGASQSKFSNYNPVRSVEKSLKNPLDCMRGFLPRLNEETLKIKH